MNKKILIGCTIFLLTSCSAINVDYLDDNYSDRINLAKKTLGSESTYFDTSTYEETENQAIKISTSDTVEGKKILNGGVNELVLQFKLIGVIKGNIAISGNSAHEASRVLVAALAELKSEALQGVTVLYIGDEQYWDEIETLSNEKGVKCIFAKRPKTTH